MSPLGFGLDWDMVRWVNVGLSCLVVSLLVMGAAHRWHSMPRRFRRITPWVVGTYVIIAYGSGEIATADTPVPPGLRVGLIMIDLLGLIVALLYGMHDDDYSDA